MERRGFPRQALAQGFQATTDRISERALPILIIIDSDFRVVMASHGSRQDHMGVAFVDVEAGRLAPALDEVVRDLVASWSDQDRPPTRFGFVPPCYIVRVIRLNGSPPRFMAVMIEQARHRDSLTRAAHAHSLSPRETEVLWLIIEGASASEIAGILCLADSTVQGYFKHLLSKTDSRNRPSMVAKVLGWEGIPAESAAYAGAFARARWNLRGHLRRMNREPTPRPNGSWGGGVERAFTEGGRG